MALQQEELTKLPTAALIEMLRANTTLLRMLFPNDGDDEKQEPPEELPPDH